MDSTSLTYEYIVDESSNADPEGTSEEALINDYMRIEESLDFEKQEIDYEIRLTSLSENLNEVMKDSSISFIQSKKYLGKNIQNALRFLTENNNQDFNDSYYSSLDEFHGIIESVDEIKNTFTAFLKNIKDNSAIRAEIDFNDVQFESDKSLIKVGASIIWIIGQETQILSYKNGSRLGPKKNISRIIFRRKKVLYKKNREIANDNAIKWARFFAECSTEENS